MAEQDFSSNFINTFRTNFAKDIRDPLRPDTVLKQFCNTEFTIVTGKRVRIFTDPVVIPNEGKWADRNDYEKIARQSAAPLFEEFDVEDYLDWNVAMALQDEKISEIPNLSDRLVRSVKATVNQKHEIDIASNFVFADVQNIITGFATTVDGNVTAGATSFDVASGAGASITVGDICFIESTAGNTVAVLVKSKLDDTITIEDDDANFPVGPGNKAFFKRLATALPAITSGATVKVDVPVTVSKTSYYDALVDLSEKPLELDAPAGGYIGFDSLAPGRLLKKDDSTLLKNDFLGKETIVNGTIMGPIAGLDNLYRSNNGVKRVDAAGVTRYYPLVFKKNFSIHYVDWLSKHKEDIIQETAGTVMSSTGIQVRQTKVLKNHGQKTMAVGVFKI